MATACFVAWMVLYPTLFECSIHAAFQRGELPERGEPARTGAAAFTLATWFGVGIFLASKI